MNPLSNRARKLSLAITLILFVIISPLVLAYSIGYRLDDLSKSFGWVKTGGIYIYSDLTNTEVYKDDKFVKAGGYIIKNIFIQNLRTDRDYIFEVKKEGYHSWRKVLPIKESYVTEAHAMMFPKEIEMIAILPFIDESGVATTTKSSLTIKNPLYFEQEILFEMASSTDAVAEGFLSAFSNTINARTGTKEEEVLDAKINSSAVLEEIATTTAVTTKTASTTIVIKKEIVPKYFLELGIDDPDELENLIVNNDEVGWIEDGSVIVSWIGKEDRNPYYYCTIEECKKSIKVNFDKKILSFNFMPGRNDVIFVLNEEGLWATELDDRSVRNIQPIYFGDNIDFRINSNNRVVVLDDGIFYELRF